MDDQFSSMLFEAILGLATMVAAWALKSARDYFKQKVENEYVQQLLLRLSDAVETGVREAAQTLVPAVKAAAQDGKITKEEAKSLRDTVKVATLNQLTTVDRAALEDLFDRPSLERKLDSLIEAAVQKVQKGL